MNGMTETIHVFLYQILHQIVSMLIVDKLTLCFHETPRGFFRHIRREDSDSLEVLKRDNIFVFG